MMKTATGIRKAVVLVTTFSLVLGLAIFVVGCGDGRVSQTTPPINTAGNPLDMTKWMALIDDTKYISELSIPGTHDSGAIKGNLIFVEPRSLYIPWWYMYAQNYSIAQQLSDGIRFLDIRLSSNHLFLLPDGSEDPYVVHGDVGFVYSDHLISVLQTITEFLNQNPSETVLLSIKCDQGEPIYIAQQLRPQIGQYPFLTNNGKCIDYIPTLGQARGKIILIRRIPDYYGTLGGIDLNEGWEDNSAGFLIQFNTSQSQYASIEDLYHSPPLGSKEDAIRKHILLSNSDTGHNTLWITFASATDVYHFYIIGWSPRDYADHLNPMLYAWLGEAQPKRLGIVLLDFYKDIHSQLASRIAEHNF